MTKRILPMVVVVVMLLGVGASLYAAQFILVFSGNNRAGPTPTPSPPPTGAYNDEFVGPFSSWTKVTNVNGSCAAADPTGNTDSSGAIQCNISALTNANASGVIFFPAGTYRIGTGLTVPGSSTISLIGADPSTTSLLWAGGTNGTMLNFNGSINQVVKRLTFNGNNVAGVNLVAISGGAVEDALFTDNVFSCGTSLNSSANGLIITGNQQSESNFWRNTYQNCGNGFNSQGVSQNVLDQWIWYSTFSGNNVGITGLDGNFSVYGNYFTNDHVVDISLPGNSSVQYPVRSNVSIGSHQFLTTQSANFHAMNITGNRIVNTAVVPSIVHSGAGGGWLMDNQITNTQSPPYVTWNPGGANSTLVSLGNNYSTLAGAENVGLGATNSYRQVDAVQNTNISSAVPTLPRTPPNNNRTLACDTAGAICDLAPGTAESTIQSHINAVCNGSTGSNRAVIHLQGGVYSFGATLSIPTYCDVQVIGDGICNFGGSGSAGATNINWVGAGGGVVIQVHGHSQASISDLCVSGSSGFDAFHINSADVAGSRINIGSGYFADLSGNHFTVTGLTNTAVSVFSTLIGSPFAYAANVTGTGVAGVPSVVSLFGANVESGCTQASYVGHVSNQGRLNLMDNWIESSTLGGNCGFPMYVVYENTGDSGAINATGSWGVGNDAAAGYVPNVYLNGFNGFSADGPMSSGGPDGNLLVQVANGTNTTSLQLGWFMPAGTGAPYYSIDTTHGVNSALGLFVTTSPLGNVGTTTDAQIRSVAALTRASLANLNPATYDTALPAGVDDVRINHVMVRSSPAINAVVIVASPS